MPAETIRVEPSVEWLTRQLLWGRGWVDIPCGIKKPRLSRLLKPRGAGLPKVKAPGLCQTL